MHETSGFCCLYSQQALPECCIAQAVYRRFKTANFKLQIKPVKSSTNLKWKIKITQTVQRKIMIRTISWKICLLFGQHTVLAYPITRYCPVLVAWGVCAFSLFSKKLPFFLILFSKLFQRHNKCTLSFLRYIDTYSWHMLIFSLCLHCPNMGFVSNPTC